MNEYTIDANGVTLNGGRTWQDADHLNVRTESGTTNFHAEAKCAALPAPPECSPIMVSAASRIGESFIPWSDLGIDPASCIEWVQFSRANYHFGEAGEDPLCLTAPEPEPDEGEKCHVDRARTFLCECSGYSEDRGGGYFELMLEPEPDCPIHGEGVSRA